MRKLFILWITSILPILLLAQNCLNSDLESGTLDGFTAYHGTINEAGQVILEAAGILPYRHDIMHLSDGFDTVALAHCEINRLLPVVPPNGGQYTLRLGNAIAGSKAEKVVFRFKVTPDLTFFQLRYAVVLNDPAHEEHEQPRFELRISDSNNNLIPCGEYKVRAAKEIPSFESCREGWRVRPWTTVGFGLQEYVGQELQIEFLTADCTKGAHAGYAYLEATCETLEIAVDSFCPEASSTRARVTPGFEKYEWNTGATTPDIEIKSPQTETPYQVTITSATGCTFVLEDQVADTPRPSFLSERSLTFCRDTQYWFTPRGTHLQSIYSPTLSLQADSFLIGTDPSDYTFIATSRMGCFSDTLQFSLSKGPLTFASTVEGITCYGDRQGSISVQSQTDFPPLHYRWDNGEVNSSLSQLAEGDYTLTISDAINCSTTTSFTIASPPDLQIQPMMENSISCYGSNDGMVAVQPMGGTPPYQFQWSAQSRNTNIVQDLPPGNYTVTVVDANDCSTQYNTSIVEPESLYVEFFTTDISCFGGKDGDIDLDIQGGTPPYIIDWDRYLSSEETLLEALPAGDYEVIVTDNNNCKESLDITLLQPNYHDNCGTYIPNAFSPNGDLQNDIFYVAGSLTGVALNSLQIFNRWGELVYENSGDCPHIGDPSCGWDGTMRNRPAPEGVYLYVIQMEVIHQAEPLLFRGDISLVR